MARHPLPECRWRGAPAGPGRHLCTSPLLVLPSGSVPDHACTTCHVRGQGVPGAPAEPSPAAGRIRHLAYHVYPVGEEWRPNLARLKGRISLFNGRRLVTVAEDAKSASSCDVRSVLADCHCEISSVANDSRLWEMATYPRMMRSLSVYRSESDCHWYGHAKGVTSITRSTAVRDWREAMYAAQLDHWPAIRRELESHAAVGQFLRPAHIITGSRCRWHYSGNMRWVRHLPLYQRDWDVYDDHYCGAESHLGLVLRQAEVSCLYGQTSAGGLHLYLPETWERGVRAEAAAWAEAHAADREDPMLVTVILTAAHQDVLVHQAIRSILDQTADSWQLLVMDAGRLSRSHSYERYRSDARVSVELTGESPDQHRTQAIQSWAINEAWRRGLVRGDLIVHLCDDDVLDPGWLAAVIAAARAHPEHSAWYGPAERWEIDGQGDGRMVGRLPTAGIGRPSNTLRCRVDGMQVAHRRAARTDWPESHALRQHADGWWIDALAARAEIHPIDALAGRHRHSPLSTFTHAAGVRC